MANIGIISEFNPFHTGHKYLIDSVRNENDTVVCVMSGNFVQRGDVAILPKKERVSAALKNGADLIIELPLPFSLSSAERFALGSVSVLKELKVIDEIAFGSEEGKIEPLEKIAEIIKSNAFSKEIHDALSSGETFAKLRTDILAKHNKEYSKILKTANNILGVEYIAAAKKLGFNPTFKTVKRIGAEHDSLKNDIVISASLIRNRLLSGDNLENYLPYNYSQNYANINNLETAILANLRANNSPNRYAALSDISEGLENRIYEAVKTSSSLLELYENIKTKRYTLSRIRRIILSAFLNITADYQENLPPYIRILGFNKKGEELLKKITKLTNLPVICASKDIGKLEGFAKKVFDLEAAASDIWNLALKNPQNCGNEYSYKIVKE